MLKIIPLNAGTTGPLHRSKITGIIDMAIKIGAPVIGIWDSAGGRLDVENKSLPICRSSIFYRCTQASGIVPQISAMLGPGAGNAGYAVALTDFIFMIDEKSYTFATGPIAVKEVLGETMTKEELGGARVHSQLSGLADMRVKTEDECFSQIRSLLSYLPSNNSQKAPRIPTGDDQERMDEEIGDIIPTDPRKVYDMRQIITRILDDGVFFESKAEFAGNILTGFGRLNGYSVGIIANQTPLYGRVL